MGLTHTIDHDTSEIASYLHEGKTVIEAGQSVKFASVCTIGSEGTELREDEIGHCMTPTNKHMEPAVTQLSVVGER